MPPVKRAARRKEGTWAADTLEGKIKRAAIIALALFGFVQIVYDAGIGFYMHAVDKWVEAKWRANATLKK